MSTTGARFRSDGGKLPSVARTSWITPSRLEATINGKALRRRIKSRLSPSAVRGLKSPPAPSTKVSALRWECRPTCSATCIKLTVRRSSRAAKAGLRGASKCQGLISSNVWAPPEAAAKAFASSRPPLHSGLKARTGRPVWTQRRTRRADNTVLPTPVPVPVTTRICRRAAMGGDCVEPALERPAHSPLVRPSADLSRSSPSGGRLRDRTP